MDGINFHVILQVFIKADTDLKCLCRLDHLITVVNCKIKQCKQFNLALSVLCRLYSIHSSLAVCFIFDSFGHKTSISGYLRSFSYVDVQ